MERYRSIGLLVVVAAVAFAGGMHQARRHPSAAPAAPAGDCCSPGVIAKAAPVAPLQIPAHRDRPSLVVFSHGTCPTCQRMDKVLAQLRPQLREGADMVTLDPKHNPDQAARYRVRLIPTCITVAGDGREVARREGDTPPATLLADLRQAGARLN